MKTIARLSAALALVIPAANAADIEAGRAKVATVCAACHGANGVSVSDTIPNLAAQRAGYIENQLRAFKEGSRRAAGSTSPAATMAAIAAQLNADDISNVAAYFASLQGPASGAKSDLLPAVAKSRVAFPEGYQQTFVRYHTINFPAAKQVRYYYANPAALQAAREGKSLPDGSVLFAEVYSAKLDSNKQPLIGADGFYETDKVVAFTAMERQTGWGSEIPEMLRNENWNYAVFAADKKPRAGVNQAECLGCHKPLDKVSYTFTLKELAAAKR
ncbi:MAG TPA: cytochrome P460 family protein [Usitatibacter sp.]|nr:cytochrome P460 family protein [Usitatibacter sp.]